MKGTDEIRENDITGDAIRVSKRYSFSLIRLEKIKDSYSLTW